MDWFERGKPQAESQDFPIKIMKLSGFPENVQSNLLSLALFWSDFHDLWLCCVVFLWCVLLGWGYTFSQREEIRQELQELIWFSFSLELTSKFYLALSWCLNAPILIAFPAKLTINWGRILPPFSDESRHCQDSSKGGFPLQFSGFRGHNQHWLWLWGEDSGT